MKQIPLTQGYVALVDNEDNEELMRHKWCVQSGRGGPRAIRSIWDKETKTRRQIHMARQLMQPPPGMEVDHINHDTLDNRRRVNLRICSRQENLRNRRKFTGCSSHFKGVCRTKRAKKWQASICIHGCLKHLGYFYSEVEAAHVYNIAATQNFGEFALLNDV